MNTSKLHILLDDFAQDISTWRTLESTLPTSPEPTVTSLGKTLNDVNALCWQILPPIYLIFGTFGNVMTVLVMRGMRASDTTASLAWYFTALAVSDQVHLSVVLVYLWVKKTVGWPAWIFRYSLFCYLPKFQWNVTGITSAWFLIAMTYQRVTSVVVPHRVGVMCTRKRGKIVVAIITLCGVAFNCHFLFTWAYFPEYGYCQFRQQYEYLMGFFEWQDLLCVSVCPFILLVTGNSVLIWHVIQSMKVYHTMRGKLNGSGNSGKVYSMSITLIITSTASLLFTLPDSIFDVYLENVYIKVVDDDFGAIIGILQTLCQCLVLSSVSTNFYLYLLTGRKFREEARQCVPCWGSTGRNVGK